MMWWREDKPEEISPPPGDVAERLSRLAIFSAAHSDDIKSLAEASQQAGYPGGRTIIREGRIPSHLYVVLRGDLEVWSTGDKGEEQRLVNTLGEGDHFGEVGILEGMPSTATVKTVGPTLVLRVSATAFLEVLAGSPAITAALIESIGGAMARSHPAYQLAAQAAASGLTPAQVVNQVQELLLTLEGKPKTDLIASLRDILQGAQDQS